MFIVTVTVAPTWRRALPATWSRVSLSLACATEKIDRDVS
jgi:hypothetical protein